MIKLSETFFFLSQLTNSFHQIRAIAPTSRMAARAMIAEALRSQAPKVILEVGPGTGPITAEIVRHLKPEDRLVLCEINPDFCAYLEKRFATEPELMRVRHQVDIVCSCACELPGEASYDYIVAAIPFASTTVGLTQDLFDTFKRLIKPGGTLSFIEYAFLREIRRMNTGSKVTEFIKTDDLLRDLTSRYQFRKEQVLLNLPPATVRCLRFDDVDPGVTENLSPRHNFKRVGIPGTSIAFNSEAADLVGGLALAAAVLARKKSRWWIVPAAMSVATAWFHRDPVREVENDTTAAYAASDGRVMKVDVVRHPRLGDQEWVRVATFLSPADVHVNRSPVGGKVIDRWDEPGGFLPAYQDESEANSSRYVVIEGVHSKVAVAQRAGFLARRILTWPKRGELLTQGERFGIIRFGSRTDVLFPLGRVEITVKAGDRLAAGQTVLARYKDNPTPAPGRNGTVH